MASKKREKWEVQSLEVKVITQYAFFPLQEAISEIRIRSPNPNQEFDIAAVIS